MARPTPYRRGDGHLTKKIQIVLINLARRPDRLDGMSAMLAEIGVHFERLDAVDGAACPKKDLDQFPRKGPIGKLSTGTRACTASHLKAMRTLLAGQSSFALILEDDVEILPTLTEMIADDIWLRGKADIIKLEKFNPRRPSMLLLGPVLGTSPDGMATFRSMYSRHTGAGGYIISRHGAEIVLSFEQEIDVPIDHFLFNETVSPLFKKLRPAILVQPILWQSEAIGLGSSISISEPNETYWVAKKLLAVRRGFLEMRLIFWQVFLWATRRVEVVRIQTPLSEGTAPPKVLRWLLKS